MADRLPDGRFEVMAKFDGLDLPGGGRLDLWSVGSGGAVFYVRDRQGDNRPLPVEAGTVADCPGLPVRVGVRAVMPEAGVAFVRVTLVGGDCPDPAGAERRCCFWCHRPRAANKMTCGAAACAGTVPAVSADGENV